MGTVIARHSIRHLVSGTIMERHYWKWFLLLLWLASSLGMPTDTTSFKECSQDCASEDCKTEVTACVLEISKRGDEIMNMISDMISTKTKREDHIPEMKMAVKQILDSSRDMISKMRKKLEINEERLESEEHLEKIKSDANTLYLKLVNDEDADNVFKLLLKLTVKVDKEKERLSKRKTTKKNSGVNEPDFGGGDGCNKCTTSCLQSFLKTELQDELFEKMEKGEGTELIGEVRKVVESIEKKKTELETRHSKEGNDALTKSCYEARIKTLEDLYDDSRDAFNELTWAEDQETLEFADNSKLTSLQSKLASLVTSTAPVRDPGCVIGKLDEAVEMMNEFEKRLEGEKAEDKSVNDRIGEELIDYVKKTGKDELDSPVGDCNESWGDFFRENLRTAMLEVAGTATSGGNTRKYQISRTNLEKAISGIIQSLETLKSEEEMNAKSDASAGPSAPASTSSSDDCFQEERSHAETYFKKINKLVETLGKFATNVAAVEADKTTGTTNLNGIIADFDARELTLIKAGNKCGEETKNTREFRGDLGKCKDKIKTVKEADDFTKVSSCIEKVKEKIKERRKALYTILTGNLT